MFNQQQSDYQSLPNYQTSDYQSLPNYESHATAPPYQAEPEYGYQASPDYGTAAQHPPQTSSPSQTPKPPAAPTDPLLSPKATAPFDAPLEVVDDAAALRKTYVPKFQALLGEFIGTMMLVAVGCGGAASPPFPNEQSEETHIGVAISFGFILMSLVQSFVPISGGHFNPIVTLCMCLSRRMSPQFGAGYFIAQMLGGLSGAGIVQRSCPNTPNTYGATIIDPSVSLGRGFLIEVWMTSVLIFVVYSTAVSSRAHKKLAPLPIAVVLTALIYFGGNLTGASMNPARSFGPAVVSGEWSQHWVYWIGPLIGGLIGWVAYQVTHFQPR